LHREQPLADVQDFRNLTTWQEAHRLTLAIYRCTAAFPVEERYGLTAQIRRSAASIGANLAEGCGRGSDADFARLAVIAAGSASETGYHLLLARDLGYLDAGAYQNLAQELEKVRRRLHTLLRRLRTSAHR
jgi:four helix bundle protein